MLKLLLSWLVGRTLRLEVCDEVGQYAVTQMIYEKREGERARITIELIQMEI